MFIWITVILDISRRSNEIRASFVEGDGSFFTSRLYETKQNTPTIVRTIKIDRRRWQLPSSRYHYKSLSGNLIHQLLSNMGTDEIQLFHAHLRWWTDQTNTHATLMIFCSCFCHFSPDNSCLAWDNRLNFDHFHHLILSLLQATLIYVSPVLSLFFFFFVVVRYSTWCSHSLAN